MADVYQLRTPDEQLARLPKWAAEKIRQLERLANERAEQLHARDANEGPIVAYSMLPTDPDAIRYSADHRVKFDMARDPILSRMERWLEVAYRTEQRRSGRDREWLTIRGVEPLHVALDAANVFHVRIRPLDFG